MGYMEEYQKWLTDSAFDEETRKELEAIAGDDKEIQDRFYKELEFGTAGLRGVIGAGTNRMNFYTVGRATQGLANYIAKVGEKKKGVAIAYDSRHMSPEFADCAALCLNANGIPAYVFDSLRPTPELSFAVRELSCIAGINITASHNPPEYNGYKVYWEDGAQITPPHDVGIMDEVKAITDFTSAKTMGKKEAIEAGLYHVIGKDIDDAYIARLKEQVKNPEAIQRMADQLKIVYSPLHGTGNIPARRVLKELGFKNVYVVKEQELPDGDFPTVSYPNPEAAEAFELGLKLAKEVDADLVLATDPDADRLGVYVKDQAGEYHTLTGNMSGCLIGDYEISQIKEKEGLPQDGYLVKTIVSTNMADEIAKYYGIYAPTTGASLKGTANAYVLGSDQYLYAASVLQDDQPMKALRGYFVLNFPSGANGAPRAKVIFNSHEMETTTNVSNVQSDNIQCTKVIRDGQLLIIRDGRTYDAQGQLIK